MSNHLFDLEVAFGLAISARLPRNPGAGGRADAADLLRGMMLDMADIDELVLQLGKTFPAKVYKCSDAAGEDQQRGGLGRRCRWDGEDGAGEDVVGAPGAGIERRVSHCQGS